MKVKTLNIKQKKTKKLYLDTLNYLYSRFPVFHQVGGVAYKPGLENTIKLLKSINNPHTRFKSIHIAGTNGKGSVSHMLASVLQTAGYKVGLFTSPHLIYFGERIRVDGKMIEKQYVIDFVSYNKTLLEDIKPSFFELTMAMAFNYFADHNVEIAVIEVGLGGRLDSTNIIKPELSVITNISFDHVDLLGNTLEKIAIEKAGIIKPDTCVIIGESVPETKQIFDAKAIQENAEVVYAEEQLKVEFVAFNHEKMIVKTSDNKMFRVGLCGEYQLKNTATVLVVLQRLAKKGFIISEKQLESGLENVCEITGLMGRWQIIGQNPTIMADTCHNVAGVKEVIKQLKKGNYGKLKIIIGFVRDKDISKILEFLPMEAEYYYTQASIPRALPVKLLEQKAKSINLSGKAYISVEQAVKSAISDSKENDFIFIGGSNFIVGEALMYFQNNKQK